MPKSRYFEVNVDSDDEADELSARQKKKANKRDETYVSIGEPLPEIEDFDAAAKQNTRPVIQARVHGQKLMPGSDMPRFHGAFTGGFSAGYFNTVGSKEGFVPSNFVSSRQQRTQIQEQKATDYMDVEDVSEHGIAPRQIRAAENFTSISKAEKMTDETVKRLPSTAIPELASSLVELVSPAQSNIGNRLLISMGWRHGQRTGPLLKKLQSSVTDECETKSSTKTYGCSMPPGFSAPDSSDSSSEAEKDLTSEASVPKELRPFSYAPKADNHGLGYSGMSVNEETSESSGGLFTRPGKRGIRGQAFGVGYEGEEFEDSDIYGVDNLKNYDFTLENKEEKEAAKNVFHGWTAPAITSGRDKYLDTKILVGFVASSRPFFKRQTMNLPTLPPNYKPVRGYAIDQSSSSEKASQYGRFDQRHAMTASIRAAILESGDDSVKKPTSVFDYVRPEDKYKLEMAVASSKPKLSPQAADRSAHLDNRNISSAPLKQFDPSKPFASDPEKQNRYEAFLHFKQINKDYSDLDLPTGFTEWDKQREREEFERSARLLQPLSWSISQRFTRGSNGATADDDTTTEVNRDDISDNLAEKKHAVKMKMFGKLTRSVLEWHPAPLLCKRFNVKNPYPDSQLVGLPKVRKSKFSVFNFLNVSEPAGPTAQLESTVDTVAAPVSGNKEEDQPEVDEIVCSPEPPVGDEEQRPSMDIFAAIFGEDSQPTENDVPEKNAEPESVDSQSIVAAAREVAASRKDKVSDSAHTGDNVNLEVSKREEGISAFLVGIFGQQAVKTQKQTVEKNRPAPSIESSATIKTSPDLPEGDGDKSFGPKMPPKNFLVGPSIHDAISLSSSSSGSWRSNADDDDIKIISSDSEDSGAKKKKVKKEKKQHRHHKKHHKKNKKSSHEHSKKKSKKKRKDSSSHFD